MRESQGDFTNYIYITITVSRTTSCAEVTSLSGSGCILFPRPFPFLGGIASDDVCITTTLLKYTPWDLGASY